MLNNENIITDNIGSVLGLQPFTIDEVFNSDVIKNKKYNGKSYQVNKALKNDDIIGNNFNSSNKTDNSIGINNYLEPEYDLDRLASFIYFSDSLYACIKAYSINICGFGYEFLQEKEVITKKNVQYYKKNNQPVPKEIIKQMEEQYSKLSMFFESISLDIPWTQIEKLKTETKFKTGNAYLEIERDAYNQLQGVKLLESASIRITKRSPETISIYQKVKNPITLEYEKLLRGKRFRKFIQINSLQGNSYIYFKEFGDTRIMNSYDGEYIKDKTTNEYITDINLLTSEFLIKNGLNNNNFNIATEILHTKIYNTEDLDGYGVPNWVSLIPTLLGVKFSDLSDFNTLEHKGLPEMLLIIEGGSAKEITKQIIDDVEQNKKLQKYKNLLIISADSKNSGTNTAPSYKNPSIRLEPLNQLIAKEGLKGKVEYIDKISERVASVFRLPTFFIGKLNNVNRSVAEVAKDMANEQVFIPESMDEDNIINMFIMPELNCPLYKYHSKGSTLENPDIKLQATKDGTITGSILPAEARGLYSELLGIPLQDVDNDFMNIPYPLSIRNRATMSPRAGNIGSDLLNANDNIASNNASDSVTLSKKKIFHLEETKDAEIYHNLKKRIQTAYGLGTINDLFIYAE